MSLATVIGDTKKTVFSLLTPKSSAAEGLCYQIYSHRTAQWLGIPVDDVKSFLPPGAKEWIYFPAAGNDYAGYTGFFQNEEQIQTFLRSVKGK